MAKYYEDNKITYQQLVMRQIQKIQEITAKELRDSTRTVKSLIGEQVMEAEDTRYSYLQSVEMLGSLLSPYFSTDVDEEFNAFTKLYDMELIEALEDKEFLIELEKIFNKRELDKTISTNDEIRSQANVYFLNFKIKEARKMFRDLINLFKSNDFLAEESFGEGGGSQGDSNMDAEDDEVDDETTA